ncbi:uncharacterized protein LOC106171824 [Lingula anatina]|uniref:Uncharacterized protein LOC106171824 n=1 Tax=Lingula anatina TaxID=7574 RepID=A0A1S3JC38_LINAN|nr:uncharacterized protein LOC106171824 [Lingula anatina]|eukprot:XP_013407751.1 uncharacterized protein LOC106171824 [Lingula anatina]
MKQRSTFVLFVCIFLLVCDIDCRPDEKDTEEEGSSAKDGLILPEHEHRLEKEADQLHGKEKEDKMKHTSDSHEHIRQRRQANVTKQVPQSQQPGIAGGTTYIRWGRTSCPEGTHLIYNGIPAGSWYKHTGSGSNYLCLPHHPVWGNHNDGFQSHSYIYGVEMQLDSNDPFLKTNTPETARLNQETAVCALCYVPTRATTVMIPAMKACPVGWTKEYNGYIMSDHHGNHRSEYVCVDEAPEVNEGGEGDQNGALWYVVESGCGTLPCPNYVSGRELTCVVCTK